MPYAEYFKAASEALIIVDRHGHILEANPKTEELFGYQTGELVGQPIELLLPQQLRQRHHEHVQNFFAAPRTRVMGIGLNLVARRKDGSQFPVEVSLTFAHKTPRGDLVVATVIDISQRLALETETRRIENATSMGTVAAGIAHDLNNPLQVILARVELMLDSPENSLSDETREDLSVVYRHAQRASQIVKEFLEISRQRQHRAEPFEINEMVGNTLFLMGEQLRKAAINVSTELADNLPSVTGDTRGFERVLINLLANARDAMPEGGSLIIRTQLDPSKRICLSVADNGSGIDSQELGKVFNLLYTTKNDGTGLGLWLSRRIIQEHNGSIQVESERGKGTIFTISLPIMDAL